MAWIFRPAVSIKPVLGFFLAIVPLWRRSVAEPSTFAICKLWLMKGSQLIFKFERDITAALEDQSLADKKTRT